MLNSIITNGGEKLSILLIDWPNIEMLDGKRYSILSSGAAPICRSVAPAALSFLRKLLSDDLSVALVGKVDTSHATIF